MSSWLSTAPRSCGELWQTGVGAPATGMLNQRRQTAPRRIPSVDDPILEEMVRRLVGAYHPERVYLFGSAARGDAGPDSDYDIAIVVSDSSPAALRDERVAYEALVGTRTSVDVVIYRASDFYGRLPLKSSLPSTVVREGKLLYAA
jgi:uncharacterized protein